MGQSLEELRPYLKLGEAARKSNAAFQLRERQAVGRKMSELVADPRWEQYGRHLDAIKESYIRRNGVATAKLTGNLLLGDEYLQVKMEQLRTEEAIKALNTALKIAKTLIEEGEKATEDLKSFDSKE